MRSGTHSPARWLKSDIRPVREHACRRSREKAFDVADKALGIAQPIPNYAHVVLSELPRPVPG